MKKKLKDLKQELKQLAKLIRSTKIEHKEYQRSNQWNEIESTRRTIELSQYNFRHKHIAYCMARGRTYEQIEPKVREGNEPNKTYITSVLDDLTEMEVVNEKDVHISA